MNVYVNRDVIRSAWGGGAHFVNALYDYSTDNDCKIVLPNSGLESIDAIVIAGLDAENSHPAAELIVNWVSTIVGKKPKLIFRVNECDARKGTNHVDERVIKIAKRCDTVVYVSNWIRQYYEQKGLFARSSIVVNGVNREVFSPLHEKSNDHQQIKIVAHHWSNNYMKGFDYYELLDRFVGENDNFEFTYIGRDRGTFSNTNVIKPLWGVELGQELRKHHIYVSASRFDPGPNHVIESIASGLPTYVHVDGGGAVEFAGKTHVYETWDGLKNILLTKNYSQNVDSFSTWRECISQFYQVVKSS